jgi:hypothetical protein
MVAFAGLAVGVAVVDGQRAQRLQTLVSLAQRVADLGRTLQAERAAAVALLVHPGPALTERTEAYLSTIGASDASVTALRASRLAAEVPPAAAGPLDQLITELGLLPALRGQAQGGTAAASAVAFRYRIMIASTVEFREVVAQAAQAPAEVANRIRAAVDLSRAAEALGQQQATVLRVVGSALTPADAAEITATRTAFTDAVVSFTSSAPPQWRSWWGRATLGPEVLAAQQLQDSVGRTGSGQVLQVGAVEWARALARRIELVHEVEARADGSIMEEANGLGRAALRRTVLESVAVLAAALLAVGLAFQLGRPVVRDLRRLRDGARAVAYEQLPQLVARLNQPRAWREVNPDAVATNVPSTGVTGKHEVGEVAAAFDDVYRAAVRSAAELARSRLGISQMLVTLARRVQRRTSQMTAELDKAERDEQDSARLAWLFGIDHMVTLTRRTTDALLVLGGHGPGIARAGVVPVLDILRAAASRIEDYTRVQVGTVDDGFSVPGHAADELVLLLAELLDNAATLSQDPVRVNARRLADRLVVQIIDTGLGIDERRRQALNARLANPVVDLEAITQMGLTVVGFLAAHHGLRVELRPNAPRGLIAEVIVPTALLRAVVAEVPIPRPRPRECAAAITGPPSVWPPLTDRTEELPIYTAVLSQAPPALPKRPPQANQFPDQRLLAQWLPDRDPRHVAATLSAYVRGISESRAQLNGSTPTDQER